MIDLAPEILRKRMFLQVDCPGPVDGTRCQDYLIELVGNVLRMELLDCFTSDAPKFGPAAWAHITTSGVHMMVWNDFRGQPDRSYVTVDVYTCQEFIRADVRAHASKFFAAYEVADDPAR